MKIQLCFTVGTKEQNEVIIDKLKKLKEAYEECDYTVHSCHLPLHIVKEKGFDETICNALADIFGDKYICEVKADNFKDAMANMLEYRYNTATKVDKLIIVSEEKVSNIAYELKIFTDGKVMTI